LLEFGALQVLLLNNLLLLNNYYCQSFAITFVKMLLFVRHEETFRTSKPQIC